MPFDLGGFLGGVGGGLMQGAGQWMAGEQAANAAQDAAMMSERAKMWTQLLGLSQIAGFKPQQEEDIGKYLQQMREGSAQLQNLPGVAVRGQQAQLGQLAGAESGAINRINQQQRQQQAGIGQSAASKGFYGSSVQGGLSNQAQANANMSIADIMGGAAAQKSNVIGQGTQNRMQGMMASAAGKQALGGAHMNAMGARQGTMRDALSTILQTGNAWGMNNDAMLMEMMKQAGGPYGQNAYTSGFSDPSHPEYKGQPWNNQAWLQNIGNMWGQ